MVFIQQSNVEDILLDLGVNISMGFTIFLKFH
jgi:hypothetical protein